MNLPHLLTSLDYSLLLSFKSLVDLILSAINTQIAINGVINWVATHDVFIYATSLLVWTLLMSLLWVLRIIFSTS